MNRLSPLFLLFFFLCSCGNNFQTHSIENNIPKEIIDIRVYSDYKVVFNGESTSFYILTNYLKDINIDSGTDVRVFFNKEAAMGLLSTLRDFFNEYGVKDQYVHVFSEEELADHFSKHLYIDILSDDSILLNGKEIDPANFVIALQSNYKPDSTHVILRSIAIKETPSSNLIVSTLKENNFQNISSDYPILEEKIAYPLP